MIGNFTPDLLNRMAQSPALTARLATRVTDQQRRLMQEMTTLASKTPAASRKRANPAAKADPYSNEWSRLPAAEKRRQQSLINFTHRRMNNLVDEQGQPTMPQKTAG